MKRGLFCEMWRGSLERNKPRWFLGFLVTSDDVLHLPFQQSPEIHARVLATGLVDSAKYYISVSKLIGRGRFLTRFAPKRKAMR